MPVNLVVSDDAIDLEVSGRWDRMMCMTSAEHVAMADVIGARLAGWDEVKAGLGWRVGGAYVPSLIATGWYAVPDRKGARQLLAVFRDRDELLVIDTRLEKPCRIVVSHPDRERLAWWINERVHPATETASETDPSD